jgi:uncharacterized SAM-binding protein YcdF (DUF218 family)
MTTLKRAIEFLLSPVGILTVLFLAGLIMSARRRTARRAPRLFLAGACLFLLILLTPLTEILVAGLERPYPQMRHMDPGARVRAIVVLAGYGEDRPLLPLTSRITGETIARMSEGIRLYRQRPGVKLVLSGGVLRSGDRAVSELMADYAAAMGVPRDDIVVEAKSLTTYENFVEVKKIVGADPFVLVSSASHLRRALGVARKLDLKATPAPATIWAAHNYRAEMTWMQWSWTVLKDLGPSTSRFDYLQAAYHEYLGYASYSMLGRI